MATTTLSKTATSVTRTKRRRPRRVRAPSTGDRAPITSWVSSPWLLPLRRLAYILPGDPNRDHFAAACKIRLCQLSILRSAPRDLGRTPQSSFTSIIALMHLNRCPRHVQIGMFISQRVSLAMMDLCSAVDRHPPSGPFSYTGSEGFRKVSRFQGF